MNGVLEAISDADLYDAQYFEQYYTRGDPRRERMYEQEYSRILQYFPHGGRVLDVGCGVGNFLEHFDDRWEKYGVEPSQVARERAAKRGITLLRSVNVGDFNFFDLVIFRGSIQHINYPMETIVQAVRVLKQGGVIAFLATPDTDSLVYSIWHRLPALDKPRNWIVFSGKVLVNILERLGMSVEIIHPYFETPYATPLQDFGKFVWSLFAGWRPFAWPGNMCEIYGVKK